MLLVLVWCLVFFTCPRVILVKKVTNENQFHYDDLSEDIDNNIEDNDLIINHLNNNNNNINNDKEVINDISENFNEIHFRKFLEEFDGESINDINELNYTSEEYAEHYEMYLKNYLAKANEFENRFTITFPGTKWCGPGNVSSSPDDLGFFSRADACCRTHDYCPDYIVAGDTKHGLTNNDLIIKLHCDCDTAFYYCLKNLNTAVARKIGKTYFDIVRNDCFKEDYPILGCEQYSLFWIRCNRYKLDTSQPKKYQWFNNPKF